MSTTNKHWSVAHPTEMISLLGEEGGKTAEMRTSSCIARSSDFLFSLSYSLFRLDRIIWHERFVQVLAASMDYAEFESKFRHNFNLRAYELYSLTTPVYGLGVVVDAYESRHEPPPPPPLWNEASKSRKALGSLARPLACNCACPI